PAPSRAERVLAAGPSGAPSGASAAASAAGAGRAADRGARAGRWAGRTPEPWRGPDVLDGLRDLGATPGVEGVLVCPQGFVSAHLEVLHDLDIEARRVAEEVGLAFARTASINDDPEVMPARARSDER